MSGWSLSVREPDQSIPTEAVEVLKALQTIPMEALDSRPTKLAVEARC